MVAVARRIPAQDFVTVQRSPELADIFHAHADFVWRALRRLGLSDADAEDAMQEVFLVVHRRLEDYEERGAIRAWLFAISRQVAGHYWRAASRDERKKQVFAREDLSFNPDPHEAAVQTEAVALVHDFLAQLDEAQATVFYLAEIEGMTAPEVSAALGVKVNTVYGRLRLARKRFEAMLRRTRPQR